MWSEVYKCIVLYYVLNQLLPFLLFSSNIALCLDVVTVLMKLNHLLVEPWLPLLWIMVPIVTPLQKNLSTMQVIPSVAGKVDPVCFMDVCIEMYSRLRQLPLLLEKRLESMKVFRGAAMSEDYHEYSPSNIGSAFSLTPSSQKLLGRHIAALPPGQATDVLQIHIQNLQRIVLDLNFQCMGEYGEDGLFRRTSDKYKPMPDSYSADFDTIPLAEVFWTVESLSLFLRHAPTSMWVAGRSRDRAGKLLATLVGDVSFMLMDMAKHTMVCNIVLVIT